MPTGARTSGASAGFSGVPRLSQSQGAPPVAAGQIFVPGIHDSLVGVSNPAPAGGVVDVTFGPVPHGEVWMLERIAVSSTSVATTAAAVYVGPPDPGNLADYTANGNVAIADEFNPIVVPAGQLLSVRWTNATTGSVCSVRIQYVAGNFQYAQTDGD